MMKKEMIVVKHKKSVAIISLENHENFNVMDSRMLKQLYKAVEGLNAIRKVRAIVLTSSKNHFCAGADLSELCTFDPRKAVRFSRIGQELCDMIETGKPVVCAVQGLAAGIGNEIAMSANRRIATSRSKFGHPELEIGLHGLCGGSFRLMKLVGDSIAKELVSTGELIDAKDALEIGMIDKISQKKDLLKDALDMAEDEIAHRTKAKSSVDAAYYKEERDHFSEFFRAKKNLDALKGAQKSLPLYSS